MRRLRRAWRAYKAPVEIPGWLFWTWMILGIPRTVDWIVGWFS